MRTRWTFIMTAIAFFGLAASCEPGGGDGEQPPAFLEVEPDVLEFGADEDTRTMLVRNTGGEGLTYAITVTAQSAGVVWLEVEPDTGVVEGGGARSILVRTVNRDSLQPGSYTGQITVEAEGLDSVSISVSMTIGQPILTVDPGTELDFGAATETVNLIVKNSGAGGLVYSVMLPGPWLTSEVPLQKEILPSEPQTIPLAVNRTLVPWYGEGIGELVVTSNGLEDSSHSSTARIDVRVTVDSACVVEEGCAKEGYYCDPLENLCRERKSLGEECSANGGCKGGLCEDGVCCQASCDGPAMSATHPAARGFAPQPPTALPAKTGSSAPPQTLARREAAAAAARPTVPNWRPSAPWDTAILSRTSAFP